MSNTNVELSPEHYPVLINEVIEAFAPLYTRPQLRYLDGTFGRGGHFQLIRAQAPHLKAVVYDQDQTAIQHANEKFSELINKGDLKVIHSNFSEFNPEVEGEFDMILLDLGVSSPQLDQAERGFSFYHDGPLDMRMDQSQTVNAEYIINTASEEELIKIFKDFGEIYSPFRVVRAICHDRKTKAFQSTKQLAGLIERVDGWRVKGKHPATQYFMALRLAVNSELDVIAAAIPKLMKALTMGGRLVIISFHSLEDRIVKNLFKDSKEIGYPVTKKVIVPTQEECDKNPRSRSAKLRIFERGAQDEPRKYPKHKTIS